MSTELAHRFSALELAAAFALAEREIRASFANIHAHEAHLNDIFMPKDGQRLYVSASSYEGWEHYNQFGADRAIERLTRKAWIMVVERLELSRAMSIGDWTKLQKDLKDPEIPPIPFTEENVRAFGARARENLDALFETAIVEVFDWLRPWRQEYKSNSVLEIGPRVVVTRMVEPKSDGRFGVEAEESIKLSSLERVFTGLAGRGVVTPQYKSLLHQAITASTDGTAETEFFRVKMFANRNLHIWFKDLELLAKFNAKAGGKVLRPRAE